MLRYWRLVGAYESEAKVAKAVPRENSDSRCGSRRLRIVIPTPATTYTVHP